MQNYQLQKIFNWNKSNKSFELPSGTYWIGDISYVLEDNIYDSIVLDGGDGVFKVSKNNNVPEFAAFAGTYAGDGSYVVKINRKKNGVVSVDAGIIGIIHTSLIDFEERELGYYYTSQNPIKVEMCDGIFKFTSGTDTIIINTSE